MTASTSTPRHPVGVIGAIAIALTAAGWSSLAVGSEVTPFAIQNLTPFVQNVGLPLPEVVTPTGRDGLQWAVVLDAASHSVTSSRTDESLALDGETWRTLFVLRRSVGERWQVGIDLPLVVQENGVLDGPIDTWHDISGLPEGERPAQPRNNLDYAYRQTAGGDVVLDNPAAGIGDVRLVASRRLGDAARADTRVALRAAVKLPTGDADDFTGTGGVDVSVGLALTQLSLFSRDAWSLSASAGVLATGSADVLDDRLRDIVPWGSATIGWQASPKVALVAQLDAHRGLYDSAIDELADTAVLLTAGVQIDLGSGMRLDIAIGEDPAVDTAPDVTLHVALRRVSGGR